jgi:hypothetical protein
VGEKNTEQEAKVQTQKKLKSVESQLKRFKNKAESVQELRRSANARATIKEGRDRAAER